MTANTHQGLHCYLRLVFGIASALALFQCPMDTILQGIPSVYCYIDDILITGSDESNHFEVLRCLRQYGIDLKRSKCYFFKESIEFLGHCIDTDGLHTTTAKIKAIQLAPRPRGQTQLISFLRLIHYYGKFICNLATLL